MSPKNEKRENHEDKLPLQTGSRILFYKSRLIQLTGRNSSQMIEPRKLTP